MQTCYRRYEKANSISFSCTGCLTCHMTLPRVVIRSFTMFTQTVAHRVHDGVKETLSTESLGEEIQILNVDLLRAKQHTV